MLIFFLIMQYAGVVSAQTSTQSATTEQADYRARYGRADMNISCLVSAHPAFERGLLQMHSFAWEIARESFQEAASIDPTCAMAYWGEAMSYYDGLHEHPSTEEVEAARNALVKARNASSRTEREDAYIAAAEEIYRGYPEVDRTERDRKYSEAMRNIHTKYPEDHEAAIFHALSLLALARRGVDDNSLQMQAAATLEPLFKILPEHPGVAHYLIHAYDDAGLQERGEAAARRYAGIAPVLTHAQHMPAHIFAGIGMWEENNISNQGALSGDPDNYHALMYLAYGHLQLGQRNKAGELVEQLRNKALSAEGSRAQRRGLHSANIWLLLETHDWDTAAEVPAYSEAALDMAETWYVRGLGAVHIGNLSRAQDALSALNDIIAGLDQSNDSGIAVRSQLGHIHAKQLEALIRLGERRGDEAIALMREAVEIADRPGVNRTQPDSGTGLPAHEVFGEILLELGQYKEAQHEFTTALERTPNRFWSLLGLARAATEAGDHAMATEQYNRLLGLLARADSGLPEVVEADLYLTVAKNPLTGDR